MNNNEVTYFHFPGGPAYEPAKPPLTFDGPTMPGRMHLVPGTVMTFHGLNDPKGNMRIFLVRYSHYHHGPVDELGGMHIFLEELRE